MSLRDLRIKRGMTQAQLAEKTGIPERSISRLESGGRATENISLRLAIRLGDALRVSNLRKLLDDDESSTGA